MSSRLDNIARRKQALIEKAALERLELTTACRRIRSPIDIDGKLFGIGRLISSHPLLTAGVSTFLIGGFGKKPDHARTPSERTGEKPTPRARAG